MVSLATSSENFIYQVCEAFRKAVERASGVTLEGREREFRRVLARYLFDETLGWEEYSKIGEIYDIACFDDENFPLIIIETKWAVELTQEIKEKLRRRIEQLGSVKYGVFASEREFVVYEYRDYKLKEITKVNVAEAVGVAKKEFGLPEVGKRRILEVQLLKRERLVWIEDPEYFEKTYKEISVAKREGVKLLTNNLKAVVSDLTTVLTNFFDSYRKRKDHYSGKFLENTFNHWLKISMKDEEYEKSGEIKKSSLIEVFCRETAYVLLGRLLFIRVCEDKSLIRTMISEKGIAASLEYYGKRGTENVYLRLLDESREEIKRYYSHFQQLGFFDWWIIEEFQKGTLSYESKEIQENLEKNLDYNIKKTFRRLNRFDFAQVNRDILGDVYQGYLPPEERKKLGEFYTPKEIIEYILDAVGYKPENEIRGEKILDPACGSGGFLVEAIRRLIERYRRVGLNLKDPYDAQQIIEGCVSSIYGLDIHPFACFIAEMNMLFQLVDLYDVLRGRDYKLPRLNIFRTDSLMPTEPVKLTEFMDNSRRTAVVEETKEASKVKNFMFNYVIGNPPYVRKERIQPIYKNMLEKAFPDVFSGDADLYVYFLATGIGWLKDDGKLGYIVSNKFVKTRYGKKLRRYIPSLCVIEQFVDFGDTTVFREATNYPAIIVLRRETENAKREGGKLKVVYVHEEMDDTGKLIDHIKKNIINEKHSDAFVDIFETPQASLKEQWNLIPIENLEVCKEIEQTPNTKELSKIIKVTGGLETGRNEVYRFSNKDEALEKGVDNLLLKPLIIGEDVRKWNVDYRGRMVLYVSNIDIERYPDTKSYLEKHRPILDPLSETGRKSVLMKKKKWFELRKPSSPRIFQSEKLVTPDISTSNNFAYDDGKYYCAETCFVLTLNEKYRTKDEEKNKQLLKYFLGLLNSSLLEFYFKQVSPFISGGYYRYRKLYLDQLPLKETSNKSKHLVDEIIRAVDRILQLSEQNGIHKRKIRGFPESYLDDHWSFNKLLDIARVLLSKASYKITEAKLRTHSFRELEHPFREVFRIILATEEHVDFYSEEVASYVFEVLKTLSSITKRELLELKIPRKPHLKNLLNQYQEDREQIVKNEKAVKELEKQIDDLVYKLYEMTYKERRIIKEYLAKF